MSEQPSTARTIEEQLARKFHDTYEKLAPDFGYETRPDTKQFDPTTANGRLMVAVCKELLTDIPAFKALREVKLRLHFLGTPGESMWNAGSEARPNWQPDWRYEIDLIEHALHGSPLTTDDRFKNTKSRAELEEAAHANRRMTGYHMRHEGAGLLALYQGDRRVREIGITPGWNFKDRDEVITRYNDYKG